MKENKNRNFFNNIHPFSLKSSSVNKISKHQRYFLSQDSIDESELNKKNLKNKNDISLIIKRVFKEPKKFIDEEKKWPKVTHPKLPFTRTFYESPQSRKLKIKLTKPSKVLHEFNTIKWLQNKYSDSVIEKSIHSMLPKRNNSLIYQKEKEQQKRHRKMIEYLDSFKGPIGREKFIDINPKYLFDESTFKSILKLKEVFLEFDISGNQKMEFDEIVKMFNQNHIIAGKNDIFNLFFKHKLIKKKKDIMKLHLGFYQFINFALKKEQEFRNFMRKIKIKYNKNENNEYSKANNEKEKVYLPMNFNLVLDYFIKKEKERHSISKIEKAFHILDNDIKRSNEINSNKRGDYYKDSSSKNVKDFKKRNRYLRINTQKDALTEVNIIDLFNEFIKLYYLSCKSDENEEPNQKLTKTEMNKSFSKTRNKLEALNTFIPEGNTALSSNIYNLYNLNKVKLDKENSSELGKNILLTEKINSKNNSKRKNSLISLIKNQMNKNILKEINLQNLKKYNDINIAKEETLKQIKKDIKLGKLYLDEKEEKSPIKIFNNNKNRKSQTINNFFNEKKINKIYK